MDRQIPGLHHVTAIAGDPQQNIDFYAGFLGLRMVKQTVNFDDPETYHLYYGDEKGHPGTILTFFPWPGAPKGRRGSGQLTTTSFLIPQGSIGYWTDRFSRNGVEFEHPTTRFNEEAVVFYDPDGLQLELIAHPRGDELPGWEQSPVGAQHSIRSFYGVTLSEGGYEKTSLMLTEGLGFTQTGQEGSIYRYETGLGGPGATVDIRVAPNDLPGMVSVGTVHHVAWRTPNDEEQKAWRQDLARMGLNVTPIIDRLYFHSIYFREPGGILFEIATDPPGFTLDEPFEELGTHLKLPPWLEEDRNYIERRLPRLRAPQVSYIG